MVTNAGITDEELALRSSRGDRDAFAELYNRYFRGLYDLTFRMVRDDEVAADLVQNSFISAWESLQKRKVSGNVKAWLYAIARNTAINEIRRRKRWRSVVVREPEREDSRPFEGIDASRLSNPETAFQAQELVDLVWSSAEALGPKDYSLLDLHLRRELGPGEIAAGMGLPNARVHTMLSRLRSSLEESVGIALLIRRGRGDCQQLNDILYRRNEALNRDVKLEVRRHLQECEQCSASRKRFVAPAEIFSAIALIPVSDQAAADAWSRLSPHLIPSAGSAAGTLSALSGRASRWWASSGSGAKLGAVGFLGAIVAVPVAVTILVATNSGGTDPSDAAGTDSDRGGRVATSRTAPPGSGSNGTRPAGSPSPTPIVAGVVVSPDQDGSPTPTPRAGAGPTATPTPAPTVPGQTPAPTVRGQTRAPTPKPTVQPTPQPTPQTTPTPAPTPAPGNQADVAVTLVEASATVSAGQVTLSATAWLINNGGAASVLVDTTFAVSAPADCLPVAPRTTQNTALPLGEAVSITRFSAWTTTCSAPGQHDFSVTASVVIDSSQAITDPNPGNNSFSDPVSVTVP